jgi:hypothetical protein
MAQTFPWPVTDDELVLNRALENVVAAYGDAGPLEEAWLREAAANLIIPAYDRVFVRRTCLFTGFSRP